MYGYIYETVNMINNKRYIGKHKSKFFNSNYKGSGKYLRNSINKYGLENFSVRLIEECNSEKELNEREIYWIKYYDAVNSNKFYNIASGGEGGKLIPSKRRSKLSSGKGNSCYGRKIINNGKTKKYVNLEEINNYLNSGWIIGDLPRTEEFLRKQSISHRNKKLSESTKALMSMQRQGSKNYTYGKKAINNGRENRFILKEDINEYLNNGWKIGLIKRKRRTKEELRKLLDK